MIGAGNNIQVWVATAPVDMRKSFDGLAEVVRSFLGHDPLSGSLFVFRNRSAQRVKVLWWDRDGLAIYYKRLERGTFERVVGAASRVEFDRAQMSMLLEGIDTKKTSFRRHFARDVRIQARDEDHERARIAR